MKRLAILLILAAGPAAAHSWYPSECCSDADCEMISAQTVRRSDDGWVLPTGQVIPFDQARPSLDDEFHWCRSFPRYATMPVIQPNGKPPCFFAPEAKG
ncbi:hypothetical protein [uncultured Alsobacter sp.]|uniref:hypothetical protein n=1 Tax=uncultured Alsobacter sp. TaxID=1748258 RepID=UPI0025D318A3|nr:hypothetical protein [uncultured Alsobacter sp.]